nr:MAG TPA: hypothetical protein [Caudoviricetes sp.]
MKLRELVEKIDNDIVLWIVRAPDTDVPKAMIMDSKRHCPASEERIADFAKMSDEEQGDRLKCAFERGAIHV